MKTTSITKLLLIAVVFISSNLFAQVDKDKDEFAKEFESFKNKIQKEFDDFKNKNDSVFVQFLKDSWYSFDLIYNEKPEIPKPVNQPVIKHPEKIDLKITPIKKTGAIKITPGEKPIDKPDIINKLEKFKANAEIKSNIDFYGRKLNLYYNKNLPLISKINGNNITAFYREASSNSDLIKTVLLLKMTSDEYGFNDWGFLKLLQKAAAGLYSNINDKVLFTWFALLQNGYNVKAAYNNDNVYLLIPSDQEIFNTSYFTIAGQKYYVANFKDNTEKIKSLIAHKADYPGNSYSFSLLMEKIPDMENDIIKRDFSFQNESFTIPLNLNLIEFFGDYPDCALEVYFHTPLSKNSLKGFDSFFNQKFNDKNELWKINYLLDFVQHSLVYLRDEEQFGQENYLFAEETLYYSGADCEDRAVLLAQLIKHFTGLQTIGLSFSEHISLAVNLTDPVKGVYIPFKGNKYYISDPTYIGAECGMLMSELRNETPEIIEYD